MADEKYVGVMKCRECRVVVARFIDTGATTWTPTGRVDKVVKVVDVGYWIIDGQVICIVCHPAEVTS